MSDQDSIFMSLARKAVHAEEAIATATEALEFVKLFAAPSAEGRAPRDVTAKVQITLTDHADPGHVQTLVLPLRPPMALRGVITLLSTVLATAAERKKEVLADLQRMGVRQGDSKIITP